jgi:uncharacterized protein YlxP (DUF503 family)
MFDENGKEVTAASPGPAGGGHRPVGPAQAGDEVRAVTDERIARGISQTREARQRQAAIATSRAPRLEDLFARIREGQLQELPLIIKADVMGSVEAIDDALGRIEIPEVRLRVLHKAAGAITEDDVTLAAVAGAIIIGFSVRPTPAAPDLANREGVDIRLYSVIYQVVEDIEKALKGLLAPEYEERQTGTAEVRRPSGCRGSAWSPGRTSPRARSPAGARPAWSATAWSSTTGDRLAAPLQGGRAHGRDRLRVRHRPGQLPGHPRGRPDRGLRDGRDPTVTRRPGAPAFGARSPGHPPAMFVALLRLDLRLPDATSLKDKRSVVKGLAAALRKLNCAVAEVDHQDLRQRATLAVATVAGEGFHARRVLVAAERETERTPGVELLPAT